MDGTVAGPEVADHAAGDQRLHDGVGAGARCARQTCEPRCACSRGVAKRQAVAGTARLHQFDEQIGQRQRLGAQGRHAAERLGGQQGVEPAVQRRHADDGLGAAQVARDAGGGLVVGRELERRGVAPPAGQRLPEAVGVPGVHPDKGRRAGAAVEVFVAAADGEIGLRAGQVHRHGTRAVRQVPDREDAGGVGGGASPRPCRAWRRCGSSHGSASARRHRASAMLRSLRAPPASSVQPRSRHSASAMYRSVGKLLRSLTRVLRCGASSRAMFSAALSTLNRLMEVLSVATTSSGPAPIRRAILSPSALGRVEPAGAVPAADQALAPFLRHHFGHARSRGPGQDAQELPSR